jgi:hypothetical protein
VDHLSGSRDGAVGGVGTSRIAGAILSRKGRDRTDTFRPCRHLPVSRRAVCRRLFSGQHEYRKR